MRMFSNRPTQHQRSNDRVFSKHRRRNHRQRRLGDQGSFQVFKRPRSQQRLCERRPEEEAPERVVREKPAARLQHERGQLLPHLHQRVGHGQAVRDQLHRFSQGARPGNLQPGRRRRSRAVEADHHRVFGLPVHARQEAGRPAARVELSARGRREKLREQAGNARPPVGKPRDVLPGQPGRHGRRHGGGVPAAEPGRPEERGRRGGGGLLLPLRAEELAEPVAGVDGGDARVRDRVRVRAAVGRKFELHRPRGGAVAQHHEAVGQLRQDGVNHFLSTKCYCS